MADLTDSLGLVEFHSVIRNVRRDYTGVSIAAILRRLSIDTSGVSTVTFRSYDGFSTVITIAQALDEELAFIAVTRDGESFKDMDGDWAKAPFLLVLTNDPFGQFNARYVTEIVVE